MERQFIVHLQDRPGSLAHLARLMASHGIDLRHIAGAGSGEHAFAMIATSDDGRAEEAMRAAGYEFVTGQTLLLELQDRPGELAHVAERLAEAGITILGLFLVGHRDNFMELALTVDDRARARSVLGLDA